MFLCRKMSNFANEMTDATEFDSIFRQYYEPLFHFAHQFITDDEECHDIVSAAYESVWNNYASIEYTNVRQYLYTTVRNKAIDHLRRDSKRRAYTQYITTISEQATFNERIGEHDDEHRIIQQILDELGYPTGYILRQCYIEEKKYREVAEEMGVSIAMVKKHIVKALKRIREIKKTIK